ncbi:hypothetical protein LZ31DRAFT_196281 [Colletotrichum somersetense]|nr:hypothetical protein LZ31DRAFT_196281 [Colletotrichum somersetense]
MLPWPDVNCHRSLKAFLHLHTRVASPSPSPCPARAGTLDKESDRERLPNCHCASEDFARHSLNLATNAGRSGVWGGDARPVSAVLRRSCSFSRPNHGKCRLSKHRDLYLNHQTSGKGRPRRMLSCSGCQLTCTILAPDLRLMLTNCMHIDDVCCPRQLQEPPFPGQSVKAQGLRDSIPK